MKGWLGEFWEQGMEEPAWRVFQHERLAESREAGWSPEGMHRLAEGDELTVFSEDGGVLWSGRLAGRRVGWFSRLAVESADWHPADVAAEVWQEWFRAGLPAELR